MASAPPADPATADAPQGSGATPAPSRRERRRLEVRDRIVAAALSLFETQGFEATTVTEIARRADIAYGTFFNHFPTKLDLLRELSAERMRGFFEDLEQVRKQPGGVGEHLVALFVEAADRVVAAGEPMRELHAAMMALAFPETADADDRLMRMAFRDFLAEGIEGGELRSDVDLDTLTEVVVGSWYSLFLSWVHHADYPMRERASAVARFLARTLTDPGPTADARDTVPPPARRT